MKKNGRRLQLMQLEPRQMFDGAAVDTVVDTVLVAAKAFDTDADTSSSETTASDTPLAVAYEQSQAVSDKARQQIKNYLQTASVEELFSIFNGGRDKIDSQWLQSMETVRQQVLHDQLEIQIDYTDSSQLQGHPGAYTSSNQDGEANIYLNQDYLNDFGEAATSQVLIEEFGHAIDAAVNRNFTEQNFTDSFGDEGALFAARVRGDSDADLANYYAEDDAGHMSFESGDINVEWATFQFSNAYAMVYDLDNNSSVTGNTGETAAEKEQNHINFDPTSLGAVTIDDNEYNSSYFSGNDVSAIAIKIDTSVYNGWISRPIKSNGEVRGFYFWTDTDFTTLATAQADGNRDADGNAEDNLGFILVVDQAWFDSRISSTSVTVATDIDGVSGLHTYASVGSSSDRVDSNLNQVIDANPANSEPVLVADTNSTGVEQGVVIAGVNPTGNVLTNDSDVDGDSLKVLGISSSAVSGQTSVTAGGVTISGLYGTLTINSLGAYSYSIDNTNATVDGLLNNSISDQFTYSVTDGNGNTKTSTLTLVINGSNDAPTAVNDYNSAKEELTATTPNEGYLASGNVITNDTDVDATDTLVITGVSNEGSATGTTAAASNTGATTLSFTSLPSNVSVGYYVFDDGNDALDNKTPGTLFKDASNVSITIASIDSVNKTFTLSGAVANATITNGQILGFGNNESGAAYKDAVISSSVTQSFSNVNLTNLSGSIAVGMTVTGGGLPAGVTVTEVVNTGSAITGVKISSQVSLTGAALAFNSSTSAGTLIKGQYGDLTLNPNGSYSYNVTSDTPLLGQGESAQDIFNYQIQDGAGETSSAQLIITAYGSSSTDPIPVSDTGTATEMGVLVAGSAATGNVLANDAVTGNGFVKAITYGATSSNVGSGVTGVALAGQYGTLVMNGDGSFSYQPDNANTTVNALNASQTLTDSFSYTVGTDANTGISTSTLVITIQGANDEIIAVDDSLSIFATSDAESGNLLLNDTDVDNSDTKTITEATAGSHDDQSASHLPSYTSVDSNGVTINGSYGDFIVAADGSYSYTVNQNNASVLALAAGQSLTDVMTYRVVDSAGDVSDAVVTITIQGVNDKPVNSLNSSSSFVTGVQTAQNTAFAFSSGNQAQLQVSDVDGDLSLVILNVDHGTLSVTAGNTIVTGDGTSNVTLSGSQSDINLTLASLVYTPETNFLGTDFLTLFSQDGQNAYDSDGVAINIPQEYVGPVVSESDLASGTNSSGTAESGNVTISAPSGQSFVAGQSGSTSYGSWSLNESTGVFSYTLTAAADHASGPVTDSIQLQTYDDYGNVITNLIVVTIQDDSPQATDNVNTVAEGNQVTGSVLSDGTADDFGADGALVTTPAGGVIGVRAAGGDTSTEVTTGTGASIIGLYGTLVLTADGDYTYTADSNAVTSSETDVFVYTIEDADGDRSTALLSITVNDVSAPTIDVTAYGPVNENSSYAMFKVSASGSQTLDLAVTNGTATLSSPSIEYSSDGLSWTTYSTYNKPVGGCVFVRVGIGSESDAVYEGAETFSLVVTNASLNSIFDTGTATIIDDGTGQKFDSSISG